jgi:hypothetical protein
MRSERNLNYAQSSSARSKKRTVGIIAIAIITVLFILGFIGYIPLLIWLIAALAVALIANLLFRRIGNFAAL